MRPIEFENNLTYKNTTNQNIIKQKQLDQGLTKQNFHELRELLLQESGDTIHDITRSVSNIDDFLPSNINYIDSINKNNMALSLKVKIEEIRKTVLTDKSLLIEKNFDCLNYWSDLNRFIHNNLSITKSLPINKNNYSVNSNVYNIYRLPSASHVSDDKAADIWDSGALLPFYSKTSSSELSPLSDNFRCDKLDDKQSSVALCLPHKSKINCLTRPAQSIDNIFYSPASDTIINNENNKRYKNSSYSSHIKKSEISNYKLLFDLLYNEGKGDIDIETKTKGVLYDTENTSLSYNTENQVLYDSNSIYSADNIIYTSSDIINEIKNNSSNSCGYSGYKEEQGADTSEFYRHRQPSLDCNSFSTDILYSPADNVSASVEVADKKLKESFSKTRFGETISTNKDLSKSFMMSLSSDADKDSRPSLPRSLSETGAADSKCNTVSVSVASNILFHTNSLSSLLTHLTSTIHSLNPPISQLTKRLHATTHKHLNLKETNTVLQKQLKQTNHTIDTLTQSLKDAKSLLKSHNSELQKYEKFKIENTHLSKKLISQTLSFNTAIDNLKYKHNLITTRLEDENKSLNNLNSQKTSKLNNIKAKLTNTINSINAYSLLFKKHLIYNEASRNLYLNLISKKNSLRNKINIISEEIRLINNIVNNINTKFMSNIINENKLLKNRVNSLISENSEYKKELNKYKEIIGLQSELINKLKNNNE
ncbi:hypothetical protein CDIK_1955 [Cucumispora dikerogammari]|nr:hypothetical protein CDIK_1955 [Cucumispora dikerogammari]